MRTLKRAFFGFMLIALLGDGTSAHAATRRRVNQSVALGTLRQGARYPSVGSSVVFAGTVGSALGRGTIVLKVVITSHPSSAVYGFRGTTTAFYSHGTTSAAFTGTGTLHAGGRFTLAGRGHYTGGTLYRHTQRQYSFTGTAPSPPQPPPSAPPPPPAPTPACAVPAGWQSVASDADLVVIREQDPSGEYRYCDYAQPSRGFQFLARDEFCGVIGPSETCSTIDGVALSYILYHTSTAVDSPACGGPNPTRDGSSAVFAVDTTSGKTVTLVQGAGGITSAGLSPPGVGAWILFSEPCQATGPIPRTETLGAYSFRTGAVTTLDSGDPGDTTGSPPSLANLQLYRCASGCPDDTAVVAWTHDGASRYQQVS
jgi:hypothetical protein